jgi:hypothetical protein
MQKWSLIVYSLLITCSLYLINIIYIDCNSFERLHLQTVTEQFLLCEWGHWRLGCFLDVGNSAKDDHITGAFPVVWCPGFMVVTPSFTHLSITFSNQRFINSNLNRGCSICELHVGEFLWKRSAIRLCCSRWVSFRNKPSPCTTIFMSVLIFALSLRWCWPSVIRVYRHNLRNCCCQYTNNVAVFVTDSTAKGALAICPISKSDKSWNFPILSHGLPLSTIAYSPTRAW